MIRWTGTILWFTQTSDPTIQLVDYRCLVEINDGYAKAAIECVDLNDVHHTGPLESAYYPSISVVVGFILRTNDVAFAS